MKKKIVILLLLVVTSSLILLLCKSYQEDTAPILGYGTIEAREIRVGSKMGGRIAQVHVVEGDTVSSGKVLISLDSRELEAQQAEARAALKSAEAMLNELISGYRSELIDRAKAEVREYMEQFKKLKSGSRIEEIQAQEAKMNSAQADYDYSALTYDRVVEKIKKGVIAQQEKDDAKRSFEMAKERFTAEKKLYELLKAGSRVEDIEIASARLAQAQAELNRLTTGPRQEEVERAKAFSQECEARLKRIGIQLEERQILAPTDARVEVCDFEPGDILAPGQVAVTLLKPDDLWVKIYIKEHELHRAEIGRKVNIIIELSEIRDFRSWGLRQVFSLFAKQPIVKNFPGTIIHIASQAEFTPRNVQTTEERGNQVFAIKVKIVDPSRFVQPGMSVTVCEQGGRQ